MDLISLNFFIFIYVIHGLPRTFAERVQIRIKEKYNGVVSYDFLTYEELINFVKLCPLIKVNVKIKKDLRTSKKELGSFCAGMRRFFHPLLKKKIL